MIIRHILLLFIILTLSVAAPVSAQEPDDVNLTNAKRHWTVMGGYGTTHKGLGATETRVETLDVILRYGYFLTKELGGSWYRGRHEILSEIPVRMVTYPETAIITGINLLAVWTFTSSKRITPYIFAGGGPVYTNLDIAGLGAELNFNYQGGVGGYYFIKKDTALNVNYRLHHISNAGTAEPNEPLNSSRVLFGVTLFR